MARFLIAILALLALAASPITALAAPMACGMDTPQAVTSSMAPMDASVDRHATPAKLDPCCDKMHKGCAKTCPMACAAGIAVLAVISTIATFEVPMALDAPKGEAWRSHRPVGPDHPPKSMA